MGYLSRNLNQLQQGETFKYYPKCSKIKLTHRYFTDDLLLFLRGVLPSVEVISQCFNTFSYASGLQANLEKNIVYFGGVSQATQDRILQYLGYTLGELPFRYLGIPPSTKKLSLLQWQPLIEKLVGRSLAWTVRKLSYAGRVQLVQSVLFDIQAYWIQIFLFPATVMKFIEAYCRSYIWSGVNTITKKALVSWDKVCTPKST